MSYGLKLMRRHHSDFYAPPISEVLRNSSRSGNTRRKCSSTYQICLQASPFLVANLLNCLPDSKVHGANMGTTWVLPAPHGPHVGPMNLVIRALLRRTVQEDVPLITQLCLSRQSEHILMKWGLVDTILQWGGSHCLMIYIHTST